MSSHPTFTPRGSAVRARQRPPLPSGTASEHGANEAKLADQQRTTDSPRASIHLKLRLPPDLHEQLVGQVSRNQGSLNSEIIRRLRDTFEASPHPSILAEIDRLNGGEA